MTTDPYRDYLTGLYTRQGLYILYNGLEADSRLHLMFVDIDNFKNVNDMYGHNVGDAVLQTFADIIKSSAPEASAIRLGGDEFLLVFCGDNTRENLCRIADDIIRRTRSREGMSHITTPISASVGILFDERVGGSLNDILAKSDHAMYYAKSSGKGTCVVFSDISDSITTEMHMEKNQQQALENGEIEVRYLPVISVQTSTLRLSQTRLFWRMADGTELGQEEFLPLFERNGFVRQLDMWVVSTVMSHLRQFREQLGSDIKIGIRISRLLLLESNFASRLHEAVLANGISPSQLEIEVEDSAFVRGDDQLLATLGQLKDNGFSIAIVDVGSQFRSLVYWDKLNFDAITFDREYLHSTMSSGRGRHILKTLFVMGRELRMQVMADGIAAREDAVFLSGCGCNAISGSFYSEPLSPEAYCEYVSDKLRRTGHSVYFPFNKDFISQCGGYTGCVCGSGVKLAAGISDNWGSVQFEGGNYRENVLLLPPTLLSEPSYTICMWLHPTASNSWTSALYARYRGSFLSFCPYVLGGDSVMRISEDENLNGFHDIFTHHIALNTWSFVCLTYDDFSGVGRIYINGRKAGFSTDIPAPASCRQILLGGDPFQVSYEGGISAVSFHDHVKSEEEIQEMYQSFCSEPGFCGEHEDFWE